MKFETNYDRRVSLGRGYLGAVLIAEKTVGPGESIATSLNPEELYKIHDWIEENVERPVEDKKAERLATKIEIAKGDLKHNAWSRHQTSPADKNRVATEQHGFWRDNYVAKGGKAEDFDREVPLSDYLVPEPTNAREVIDGLPVEATFTLTNSGGTVRYFRKTSESYVTEYTDEYMDTPLQGWDLGNWTYGKNLFTGWTLDAYAEFTPVERKPLTLQHWEQMPVGAEFGFGDGNSRVPENRSYIYTKLDEDYYGSGSYRRNIRTDTTPNDRSRGLYWRAGGYVYGPEVTE